MTLSRRLWFVYLSGFLIAGHYALVAYVNSSLLSDFVSNRYLNILYILGSLLSIGSLSLAPVLFRKYGSVLTFVVFIALQIIAILGLGAIQISFLIIILFLLHQATESALYFCLDVHLEQETRLENTTGGRRGTFLTIQNIAWIGAPFLLSILISGQNYGTVYLLSGLLLLPLIFIVSVLFKNTKKADKTESNLWQIISSIKTLTDKTRIIGAQFILNFFYAWMVIYLPLLLTKEIGFGWEKIGLIFTIMLLPFLLFELPAGLLGDRKLGEKELLIAGFIIMAATTALLPSLGQSSFVIWALVLFGTRVGASLTEISSESYFFKHVKADDTALISLFRMVRPLSFVLAPLIALLVIPNLSYSNSFYFLAIFTLLGLLFIPKIDTR
jgi:MFS family permease